MGLNLAPGGWGYAPGTPLGPITSEMLPDLPRSLLTVREQNKAITETLRTFPRRREWGPPGPTTTVEVAGRAEAHERIQAWLAANRNRLFREVARAKYPRESPERAAKRLYRELRG